MKLKKFEAFDKGKFVKDKIKSFYVDKYKKKKDLIDNLQVKMDFDSPKEEKQIDVTKQLDNTPIPTISELENKYKLFNKDGARKRFLQENYNSTLTKCAALSRTLRESGLPYLAKIVPYSGEKGDYRYYHTIIIYLP